MAERSPVKLPYRIWLTNGDEDAKVFGAADEITWCEDKITDHDVSYVREDGKGKAPSAPTKGE